jgi:hypothetical protein
LCAEQGDAEGKEQRSRARGASKERGHPHILICGWEPDACA